MNFAAAKPFNKKTVTFDLPVSKHLNVFKIHRFGDFVSDQSATAYLTHIETTDQQSILIKLNVVAVVRAKRSLRTSHIAFVQWRKMCIRMSSSLCSFECILSSVVACT